MQMGTTIGGPPFPARRGFPRRERAVWFPEELQVSTRQWNGRIAARFPEELQAGRLADCWADGTVQKVGSTIVAPKRTQTAAVHQTGMKPIELFGGGPILIVRDRVQILPVYARKAGGGPEGGGRA